MQEKLNLSKYNPEGDHIDKISGQQIDISEVSGGICFVKQLLKNVKLQKKIIHLLINNKEHMSRPGNSV